MAEIFRTRDDNAAAIKYAARQLGFAGDHAQPWYYYGKLLLSQGQPTAAITALEKAVSINNSILRYRLILAEAYRQDPAARVPVRR